MLHNAAVISIRRFLVASVLLGFAVGSASAVPPFTIETGVRVSSGTPQAIDESTAPLRLYFLRDGVIRTATSTAGLTWGEEAGIRLSTATTPFIAFSSVTGATLLPLDAGGYRMLYSVVDSAGEFRIHSATSADGLAFANDGGVRIEIDGGSTFVGSPRLVERSAVWRLYYVRDANTGNDEADYVVATVSSVDEGLTWTSTAAFSPRVGEIGVSTRTDGRVRLVYTAPLIGGTTQTQILSALSTDANGTAFTAETGVRFSTTAAAGELSFPLLVRSTESFRWRLYTAFTAAGSTTPAIYSALTTEPDPTGVSPPAVSRAAGAQTFTVSGEVFSSTPAVLLRKTGQSDVPGTLVNRTSDLALDVVFNTNGLALGFWDLVVTNNDGVSATRANALLITFDPGSVTLTDNLFRPLIGDRTRIDVTQFADGRLRLTLWTLDGRLVRTLVDAVQPSGTFTTFWDGTNDQGQTVASGTYLLKSEGPKVDRIDKIILIK